MTIPSAFTASVQAQDEALAKLVAEYSSKVDAMIPAMVRSIQEHQGSDGKLAQSASSARFIKRLLAQSGRPLVEGLDEFLSKAGDAALDDNALVGVGRRELGVTLKSTFDDLSKGMIRVSRGLQGALQMELATLAVVPKSHDVAARSLADTIGRSVGQAKTLVLTASSQIQRDLHTQALNQLPTDDAYVIYMGPVDGRTRPFCAALEGKAIRKQDLSRLDNGQRGASNVARHGGGWNCRHRLMPATGSLVRRRGIPIADSTTIARANAAAKGEG